MDVVEADGIGPPQPVLFQGGRLLGRSDVLARKQSGNWSGRIGRPTNFMSQRRSRDLEMFFLKLLLLTLTESASRLLEMERRSGAGGGPMLSGSSVLVIDSLVLRASGEVGASDGPSQWWTSASLAVKRSLKR